MSSDKPVVVTSDPAAFESLVAPHRRELEAHCYRMLGSVHDAEDALQESLVAAWQGLGGFEGRASLRSWLYKITTNTCLRQIANRPKRILSPDHGPARGPTDDLGEMVTDACWLEPWPDRRRADPVDLSAGPADRYLRSEGVELAFVAALQHLPGTQRAALILCEVMDFSAAEAATILNTTTASVNSALQRARKTLDARLPGKTQRDELVALGTGGEKQLVHAFVTAWERRDVSALLGLLTEDARFAMPPLPAWFDGRADVGRFFAERVFATSWRLFPLRVNGQLGFACYTLDPASQRFHLGAVNVLTVRDGRIASITGFLDPATHRLFGLPDAPPAAAAP
jgi:RNA polymerase sigma-70 factor (TIGR02960 family)